MATSTALLFALVIALSSSARAEDEVAARAASPISQVLVVDKNLRVDPCAQTNASDVAFGSVTVTNNSPFHAFDVALDLDGLIQFDEKAVVGMFKSRKNNATAGGNRTDGACNIFYPRLLFSDCEAVNATGSGSICFFLLAPKEKATFRVTYDFGNDQKLEQCKFNAGCPSAPSASRTAMMPDDAGYENNVENRAGFRPPRGGGAALFPRGGPALFGSAAGGISGAPSVVPSNVAAGLTTFKSFNGAYTLSSSILAFKAPDLDKTYADITCTSGKAELVVAGPAVLPPCFSATIPFGDGGAACTPPGAAPSPLCFFGEDFESLDFAQPSNCTTAGEVCCFGVQGPGTCGEGLGICLASDDIVDCYEFCDVVSSAGLLDFFPSEDCEVPGLVGGYCCECDLS